MAQSATSLYTAHLFMQIHFVHLRKDPADRPVAATDQNTKRMQRLEHSQPGKRVKSFEMRFSVLRTKTRQ